LFSKSFLSSVSILMRDIDIANLFVCPSVRPSVRYVPVSDENDSFFHRIILFLPASNIISQNSDGVILCRALNTGGVEKIRDFQPISRYISQTIQIAIVTMEGE